ncbi:chromate transporter, partial [uncultured Veillonella sp.]
TLSIISYCYDYFIQNKIIAYMLRGMQCGATALILNVGIDLAVKQCKKKLALPLLILLVTFIGNAFFQLNIMTLIILDGLVGFFFMRAAKYN